MRSHCIYKEELWNWKYLHVRSQERCTGRDACEFPRATVPESNSNCRRRNCETQSTYMWEVKKDVLEEMPVNFQELLCQNQTVTVEGGIVKLKVLTCEKSRKMYWKRYLWSSGRIFLKMLLKMLKKHDSLLMQFWCSFEITSKVHHIFLDISTFFPKKCWTSSKNMMHFRCSFGAVLKPHQKCIKTLWNYIKSASKWCSFKTASKLHQKCGHFYKIFLKISWKSSKNMMHFWCSFDAV